MRLVVKMAAPKKHLGFVYRMFAKLGIKIESPQPAMRQLWSDRGTTAAVALSIENGDAPLKNWTGVGARDLPLSKKGWKLDGAEVDKMITRKLSCGDCPAPCKGIVRVKSRGLSDVRRPDYETIVGFGANIPERRPGTRHRLPRRLQPLWAGRGELQRHHRLGVRSL